MMPGRKNRIVLKVGSSIIVENGEVCEVRVSELCKLLAELEKHYEVILVTSAAVASGYTAIKLDKSHVPNKQALASVGQPLLMGMYHRHLSSHGVISAQLLLGAADFDSRKKTHNAQNCMEVLLANNVLPVINENDATALGELVFGDNDRMSAHVANHFDASLLVILSDVDGLYDSNPRENPDAKLRRYVYELKDEELRAVATPNNAFATGGIVTKLQAAKLLLDNNRKMFLTSGFDLSNIRDYLLHDVHSKGTLFISRNRNDILQKMDP